MTSKRKNFTSPSMAFLSPETIDRVDGPAVEEAPAPRQTPSHTTGTESKSRRVQLLMQPSLYEAVRAKADSLGISVNEAISEAVRAYTK